MGRHDSLDGAGHGTTLSGTVRAGVETALAAVDADLAARYPGEPATRQPVHTVYVPADALATDTVGELVLDWGTRATALLDRHAPDAATLAGIVGRPADRLADEVYDRVRAKLVREPVEDLRIDFEDGYGPRPDAEEDTAAVAAARTLAAAGGGRLPEGLVLTLPKVTYTEQVAAMVRLVEDFERATGLAEGRIGFEIQIETTQSILGSDGRATVARMIDAAEGRATGLHYGTFDYSASCGVGAAYQSMEHPVADHAKAVMQVAAAGTGVRLSDGSTNVIPTGDAEQVRGAWQLHHRLVRRSLERAYYQGWDMHPGHLPTRYAAVYSFYREGLPQAAARLAAYVARAGGDVMDEPATAKALSGYLLRGLDCGAVDPAEVEKATGLDRGQLDALAGR